jgi:hypothetical protein
MSELINYIMAKFVEMNENINIKDQMSEERSGP